MTSDEVADEVEYLQGRVTADMIKSYCGRGSQSLRGNSLPVHMYVEQRQHYSPAMLEFKSLQTVLNSMRDTAVHTDSGPWSRKMECHDQKL